MPGVLITQSALDEAVRALWGSVGAAAADIGCSERTLWRWLLGETHPPMRFAGAIRRAVANRATAKADQVQRLLSQFAPD